uniref:DNA-directed RNA polymerase subunit beta' n=1 Tax=Stigeoclonium sp. FACHB-2430 TaxID=2725788 RepID=A0A6H1U7B4_9CHLO|nr:RNA polymerase beta' subunit [Stigeoclonium sp. FACHB-2430]
MFLIYKSSKYQKDKSSILNVNGFLNFRKPILKKLPIFFKKFQFLKKTSFVCGSNSPLKEKNNSMLDTFRDPGKFKEVKLITLRLASPDTVRCWAETRLPDGKILGIVYNANTLHHNTLKPLKGGLFCERIFGPVKDFQCACGIQKDKSLSINNSTRQFCLKCNVEYTWSLKRRYQLGYIRLVSPVTHLWYVKESPSFIAVMLDMKRKTLDYITYCTYTLTIDSIWKSGTNNLKFFQKIQNTNSLNLFSFVNKKSQYRTEQKKNFQLMNKSQGSWKERRTVEWEKEKSLSFFPFPILPFVLKKSWEKSKATKKKRFSFFSFPMLPSTFFYERALAQSLSLNKATLLCSRFFVTKNFKAEWEKKEAMKRDSFSSLSFPVLFFKAYDFFPVEVLKNGSFLPLLKLFSFSHFVFQTPSEMNKSQKLKPFKQLLKAKKRESLSSLSSSSLFLLKTQIEREERLKRLFSLSYNLKNEKKAKNLHLFCSFLYKHKKNNRFDKVEYKKEQAFPASFACGKLGKNSIFPLEQTWKDFWNFAYKLAKKQIMKNENQLKEEKKNEEERAKAGFSFSLVSRKLCLLEKLLFFVYKLKTNKLFFSSKGKMEFFPSFPQAKLAGKAKFRQKKIDKNSFFQFSNTFSFTQSLTIVSFPFFLYVIMHFFKNYLYTSSNSLQNSLFVLTKKKNLLLVLIRKLKAVIKSWGLFKKLIFSQSIINKNCDFLQKKYNSIFESRVFTKEKSLRNANWEKETSLSFFPFFIKKKVLNFYEKASFWYKEQLLFNTNYVRKQNTLDSLSVSFILYSFLENKNSINLDQIYKICGNEKKSGFKGFLNKQGRQDGEKEEASSFLKPPVFSHFDVSSVLNLNDFSINSNSGSLNFYNSKVTTELLNYFNFLLVEKIFLIFQFFIKLSKQKMKTKSESKFVKIAKKSTFRENFKFKKFIYQRDLCFNNFIKLFQKLNEEKYKCKLSKQMEKSGQLSSSHITETGIKKDSFFYKSIISFFEKIPTNGLKLKAWKKKSDFFISEKVELFFNFEILNKELNSLYFLQYTSIEKVQFLLYKLNNSILKALFQSKLCSFIGKFFKNEIFEKRKKKKKMGKEKKLKKEVSLSPSFFPIISFFSPLFSHSNFSSVDFIFKILKKRHYSIFSSKNLFYSLSKKYLNNRKIKNNNFLLNFSLASVFQTFYQKKYFFINRSLGDLILLKQYCLENNQAFLKKEKVECLNLVSSRDEKGSFFHNLFVSNNSLYLNKLLFLQFQKKSYRTLWNDYSVSLKKISFKTYKYTKFNILSRNVLLKKHLYYKSTKISLVQNCYTSVFQKLIRKHNTYLLPKIFIKKHKKEDSSFLNSLYNNIYVLSNRYFWSLEDELKTFLNYMNQPSGPDDIFSPKYENRLIKFNIFRDPPPVLGGGLIQKLLAEFNPNESIKILLQLENQLKKVNILLRSCTDFLEARKLRLKRNYMSRRLKYIRSGSYKFTEDFLRLSFKKKLSFSQTENLEKKINLSVLNNERKKPERFSFPQLLGKKDKKTSLKITNLRSFLKESRPEWMVLSLLPVLPPDLRPILQIGNQVASSDLNRLYQKVLYRNERLKRFLKDSTSTNSPQMKFAYRLLQEAVDNLIDNGKGKGNAETDNRGLPLKSLTELLKGKKGRFRQNLLGKRVDYSGRSVIVVGPRLRLHECGLPKEMAIELFMPFLIQKIFQSGKASTILGAKKILQNDPNRTWEFLNMVLRENPVLLNRAPTLHRFGFQAFQPRLVEGKAILLHPLVCPAFNADFDGDQMAVHVPITVEAKVEAWKIMLARNHLLSAATGEVILVPSQDMVLGSYYLTAKNPKFYEKRLFLHQYNYVFGTIEEVLRAYESQKISLHSIIWLRWNHKFQTNANNEKLLELQINRKGQISQIFTSYSRSIDKRGDVMNSVIQTTPGRVLFHNFILKNRVK